MEALLPLLAGDATSSTFAQPAFRVLLRATVEAQLSFLGDDGPTGTTVAQGTVVFGEYVNEATGAPSAAEQPVKPPVILLALQGEASSVPGDASATAPPPGVSQVAPIDHAIRVFTPRTLENVAYCE